MHSMKFKHLYGPVPSRRLGRSLGIDLVPFKICSYDCIYCQLGSINSTTVTRQNYVSNQEILAELQQKLSEDTPPDYISLAGSGEPTLHSGIGELICSIKGMTTVPVAVLTNGSLLWMPEVQQALLAADLVLPSLDAGDAVQFEQVNRPHGSIEFARMVEGLAEFARRFTGEVWLEVFLLAGVNDDEPSVRRIAALAERIQPSRVQLNSVYRPPAEEYAHGTAPQRMQQLLHLFSGVVESISEVPAVHGESLPQGLSRQDEILALVRRRPCTANDIAAGLGMHLNDTLKQLSGLTESGKLVQVPGKQGCYKVSDHCQS